MFSTQNKLVNMESFAQLCDKLGLLLSKDYSFSIDSRKVTDNTIFCAYPGTVSDGRKFIPQALANNPSAILWEDCQNEPMINITNYSIKNLMHYVGLLSARQNEFPSQKMLTIGVTGTNGKTSISHWLNQAFNYLKQKSAIIGTTGCGVYPNVNDYESTTPDPITLQTLVKKFADNGVDVLAMEVSSHALEQGRVNGMSFQTAIFTNLTQDHLDYHKTMENYYLAKRHLFYWNGLKNAVINVDDKYGKALFDDLRSNNTDVTLFSYGIEDGDLRASDIKLDLSGMSFRLDYNNLSRKINVPILGKFNVYNLLAVFATLLANGVSWDILTDLASNLKPVIGRMDAEIVSGKPLVVVDYSHTPDSLEKALQTLSEIPHNKLICVFGCGGNRDKLKRPQMGEVAVKYADSVIITTDNPRHENPEDIINDILSSQNVKKSTNYNVIVDRMEAIVKAINQASSNDIVLVAGKGHESYQEIAGVKYHFSDLEVVRKILLN